jgi:hypothetical protein
MYRAEKRFDAAQNSTLGLAAEFIHLFMTNKRKG